MKYAGIEERVVAEVYSGVDDLVRHEGLELVDVVYLRESAGWVLRVLIDKPGGITVDDCRLISRQLGDVLDVQDSIPHAYRLEVSSPGINRPLKREHDFERFAGRRVRVRTMAPLENRKIFTGQLLGYCDGVVRVEVEEKIVVIPFDSILSAHLEVDFDRNARR
ncbi:MAG: ribosome maturation factor RimP [Deltaproteobacteria bacterium]|nr:ribosome maturation factor RimP [Deltaproteobacteria bacterium]